MTNSQIEVLKIALLNVEREELRLLDNLPDESHEFSKEYNIIKRRVINQYDNSNRRIPKRLSIILVAAIVTLTLIMSISAIRITVINFFVNVYESFISILVDNDENNDIQTIQEVYIPQYVPKSYQQSQNFSNNYNILYIWENNFDNSKIIFNQRRLSELQSFIDFEGSDYTEHIIDNQKIYYMIKSDLINVIWCNEQYLFTLSCNETLGLEEIQKIISSIVVSEIN